MEIDTLTIATIEETMNDLFVPSVWMIAPASFIELQRENTAVNLVGFDTTEELLCNKPDISCTTINAKVFTQCVNNAKEAKADFIFFVTQDVKRFGVAIKKDNEGNFQILSAHQAAFLLCHSFVKKNIEEKTSTRIVKSFLLSNVINTICDREGVSYTQINGDWEGIKGKLQDLTEAYLAIDENNHILKQGLSESESISFAFESFVDISSAALLRESTIMDQMIELYSIYGFYHDKTFTVTAPTDKERTFIKGIVENLRKNTPADINNISVRSVNDYKNGTSKSIESGKKTKLSSSQMNVFEIVLNEGTKIAIIPSEDYSKVQYNLTIVSSIEYKVQFDTRVKMLNSKMLKIIESIGKI